MLKRMLSRKIMIMISAIFALLLIYAIPKDTEYSIKDKIPQELEYTNEEVSTEVIYLLDHNDYLGRTEVVGNTKRSVENRAKELLEILINDGAGESKIPNGFLAVLPSETKIISLKYENNLLKVNLSKELLDVKIDYEEQLVEAIVYTLTSIPEVEKVIIYIEGDILTKLPQTKINLPSTLDRSFGINKEYNITGTKNINQVTIYYLDEYNDNYYYVPVTKYINDERDKIKIIIDELTSSHTANTNLLSFINSNTKLLAIDQVDNILKLKFNEYIFEDINEKNILEEVIYTISLSVKDSYDVESVIFEVNDEEIYKSVLKTIE